MGRIFIDYTKKSAWAVHMAVARLLAQLGLLLVELRHMHKPYNMKLILPQEVAIALYTFDFNFH
jgi:hypothetical protein